MQAYLHFYPQVDECRFVEIMKALDHEYLQARRDAAERKQEGKKRLG